MKCSKCGFVEVAAGKTCRHCGSSLQQSILIPFPVTPATALTLATEAPQTDWRAELRERIRVIRARRGLAAAMQQAANRQQGVTPKCEEQSKPLNPIVEAALSRIRRAGSTDVKESSSPLPAQAVKDDLKLSLETSPFITATMTEPPSPPRESSARNLPIRGEAPARRPLAYAETRPMDDSPTSAEDTLTLSQLAGAAIASQDQPVEAEGQTASPEMGAWTGGEQNVTPDDATYEDAAAEFEPYADPADVADDFESASAELDQRPGERSNEFKLRTATYWQRVRAGAVDVFVLILVNVPFAALVELNNSNFMDRRIQFVLGCMAVILYLFYMTLMLVAAGQTIGMMVAGIVAVDARSLNLPTFTQAVRRALGPLLAAAPALLGFLCPALDPQRRSISDLVSGTTVQQVFEELAEGHVSWFYHPVRS